MTALQAIEHLGGFERRVCGVPVDALLVRLRWPLAALKPIGLGQSKQPPIRIQWLSIFLVIKTVKDHKERTQPT